MLATSKFKNFDIVVFFVANVHACTVLSAKMYQFFAALDWANGSETTITENCFVQKTEDQQYYLLNNALVVALAQPPVG